jgi:hypothetical protein
VQSHVSQIAKSAHHHLRDRPLTPLTNKYEKVDIERLKVSHWNSYDITKSTRKTPAGALGTLAGVRFRSKSRNELCRRQPPSGPVNSDSGVRVNTDQLDYSISLTSLPYFLARERGIMSAMGICRQLVSIFWDVVRVIMLVTGIEREKEVDENPS